MKTICGCDGEDQRGGGGRQQYGRGQQQGYGRGGYGQDQGPTELTEELIRRNAEDIKKFLKGLKVVMEIPGQPTSRRTQRINDLVKSPRDDTFEHNGAKISVEQYYRLEKRYTIQYPRFPCLWVGPRDKNIHVPPEVSFPYGNDELIELKEHPLTYYFSIQICTIVPGQAVQKKLDEKQTASMIRFAATGTEERKQKIKNAVDK